MRHIVFTALLFITVAPLFSQEDCDVFNIQELSAAYLNVQVETIILQPDGSYEVQLSNGTTFIQVLGCTDQDYLEYDAAANTDDGSCATLVVNGCIDQDYLEYDATANTDDGSCATLVVNGCMDQAYVEYDATANTDDGNCATLIVNGCTDPAYVEYNASANTDDGSCVSLVVEGCTDAADANYDPAANTDDGSCATLTCANAGPTMDGYSYSVVEIGDQCWFAENLRTTVYADDSSIPQVTGSGAWFGLSTGARCDYNNDVTNVATFGRLYNWYAATDAAGLCPSGWHVPTDDEWTALETYVGSNGHLGAEGTALKSSDWSNGTDDFGFSALPGGYRYFDGFFGSAGEDGYWWSSSPSVGGAWFRNLDYHNPGLYRNASNPRFGFSVRCLRDAD